MILYLIEKNHILFYDYLRNIIVIKNLIIYRRVQTSRHMSGFIISGKNSWQIFPLRFTRYKESFHW